MTTNSSFSSRISNLFGDPTLIYRRSVKEHFGNIAAGILLPQLFYRWESYGRRPFYKFRSPCNHKLYKPGSSWCEELGFTGREFDTAVQTIAYKVTGNEDPQEAYKKHPIIYWTDGKRVTWYHINIYLFETEIMDKIYRQPVAPPVDQDQTLSKGFPSPPVFDEPSLNAESATSPDETENLIAESAIRGDKLIAESAIRMDDLIAESATSHQSKNPYIDNLEDIDKLKDQRDQKNTSYFLGEKNQTSSGFAENPPEPELAKTDGDNPDPVMAQSEPKPKRKLSAQQLMVGALCRIFKTSPALSGSRYARLAKSLLQEGYSPVEVEVWFSHPDEFPRLMERYDQTAVLAVPSPSWYFHNHWAWVKVDPPQWPSEVSVRDNVEKARLGISIVIRQIKPAPRRESNQEVQRRMVSELDKL